MINLSNPEGGHQFQAIVGYRDWEKVPPLVARQTDTLLKLYHQGSINNSGLARDYLHDYALEYLKTAEQGAVSVFEPDSKAAEDLDLEVREAAGHAYVALAHMPDMLTSPWLPKGYSRRGMLRPPQTKRQFLGRIREVKIGVGLIVSQEMEPRATLEAYPNLLRTVGFFKVGGAIPIRVPEDEAKSYQQEKERFDSLLDGIDISL